MLTREGSRWVAALELDAHVRGQVDVIVAVAGLEEQLELLGWDLYPLDGSGLKEAQSLTRGRTESAVMAIAAGCDLCRQEAEVVRANLSSIGITVKIEELADPVAVAGEAGSQIDLLSMSTGRPDLPPASTIRKTHSAW